MAKKNSRNAVKKVPDRNKKNNSSRKIKTLKLEPPTLKIVKDYDIALDFATKVYKKFDKVVKSIALFGSSAKHEAKSNSDIDIIILIDDVSINWDEELVAWYRQELDLISRANPYQKSLHVNTVKISTWWEDILRGDPIVINILRYGEALIDVGGFFEPLKYLLVQGKIKSTPEAIYSALQRAPMHLARSKASEMNAIEGLYWAMVDSAHAALIAAKVSPPSPEHIPANLKETFVDTKRLNMKYVLWYRDLHVLHKQIARQEISQLKGVEIDDWQEKTEEFMKKMSELIKEIIS